MGDLRDQLAAIRSGTPKSTPESSDVGQAVAVTPQKAKKNPSKSPQDSASNLLGKCLDRLPWFGRIENYDVARGFGFVSTGAKRLFLHAKGKLPAATGKITENLSNRFVVYAVGSSGKDGRE